MTGMPIDGATVPRLTNVTVWLTATTVQALNAAADQMGDSKTDTVNQAVTFYAQIIQAHNEGDSSKRFVMSRAPGKPARIDVNRPWWRLW